MFKQIPGGSCCCGGGGTVSCSPCSLSRDDLELETVTTLGGTTAHPFYFVDSPIDMSASVGGSTNSQDGPYWITDVIVKARDALLGTAYCRFILLCNDSTHTLTLYLARWQSEAQANEDGRYDTSVTPHIVLSHFLIPSTTFSSATCDPLSLQVNGFQGFNCTVRTP